MKKSTVLLSVSTALLVTAIALIVYGTTQVPAPRFTGTLKELLPPPPPGWTMTEKKIADTPEMQKAVGEILNFDDGVFVDYTDSTGERLSVYIAYWTPGKMSHRLVAAHTPDVCWVGGGWKKLAEGKIRDAAPAPTGESRTFTIKDVTEYAWFWHIVGNESKSYGTGTAPPWYAAIKDIWRKGINQREEQFFIRLSSNKPLDRLRNGAALPAVLNSIPWPNASATR